jgi:hypothetical protein
VDDAPAGLDWLHEIKYDGYRIHARLADDRTSVPCFSATTPKMGGWCTRGARGPGSMRTSLRDWLLCFGLWKHGKCRSLRRLPVKTASARRSSYPACIGCGLRWSWRVTYLTWTEGSLLRAVLVSGPARRQAGAAGDPVHPTSEVRTMSERPELPEAKSRDGHDGDRDGARPCAGPFLLVLSEIR